MAKSVRFGLAKVRVRDFYHDAIVPPKVAITLQVYMEIICEQILISVGFLMILYDLIISENIFLSPWYLSEFVL